ncbi:hypothetical protein NMG60_11006970 [Bertholletia excelsa]
MTSKSSRSSNGQIELPPGFRFHPTDDELVMHYLCPKCASKSIAVPIIAEIDLYKFDPWELPGMALYGEKEWYFFSPRDRKYPNGSRPNRAAGTGYWKATGADKPIGKPKTLGIKKALVFYAGRAPRGVKTNWIMHEYRLANVDRSAGKGHNLRLDDWVLCRIYNKKGKIEKHVTNSNSAQGKVVVDYPEADFVDEFDEQKPKIPVPATPMLEGTMNGNEVVYSHYESHTTSDSVPRLHTDSSGSEHAAAASPEFDMDLTWDNREVQSNPKWNHDNLDESPFDMDGFDFNFNYLDDQVDAFQHNDPFTPPAPPFQGPYDQFQLSSFPLHMLQDNMHIYMHNPV